MKLLMLAKESPADFAKRDNPDEFGGYMGAWYAFSNALQEAKILSDAAALEKPDTATIVSVRDGERHVEDGPYPDAREQLGGFFVIDVDSLDTAVEWAAKCPAALHGCVDIRVIPDLEEHAK